MQLFGFTLPPQALTRAGYKGISQPTLAIKASVAPLVNQYRNCITTTAAFLAIFESNQRFLDSYRQ